jgi:NADH dehydrogenase FAD-containing subunit
MDPGENEVNYLAQAHWHGFRYCFGEMIGLDRAAREVRLGAAIDDEGREITPARSVRYDTLVIAIGSVTNDFGTPGVAEHAVPLETPAQAERFNLVLAFARVLYVNGQTTDQTLAAAGRLRQALDFRATIMPRWANCDFTLRMGPRIRRRGCR